MKNKKILIIFLIIILLCIIPLTVFGINSYLVSKVPVINIQNQISNDEYRKEKKEIFDKLVNNTNEFNIGEKSTISDNIDDHNVLDEKKQVSESETEREINQIFTILNKYNKDNMHEWVLMAQKHNSNNYEEISEVEIQLIHLITDTLELTDIVNDDREILNNYLISEKEKLKSISINKTEEINLLMQKIDVITNKT